MEKDAAWYYEKYLENAKQKNYALGQECFNKALELDPYNTAYRLERGILRYQAEEYETAKIDLLIVMQFSQDEDELVQANFKLIFVAEALRDYKMCIEFSTWRIDNAYGDVLTYMRRAGFFEKEGAYHEAIKDYSIALELFPEYFILLLKRSQAYFEVADYLASIQDTTELLNISILDLSIKDAAYHWRGFAYYKLGDYTKALENVNEIMRLRNWKQLENVSLYYGHL